ncbi:ABC transporter permease [Nostocoides veronense]|uniref:ABC transporter permease n=1 Tax=Nostocoides veronense TaxID=330836 RepID=A0ABN2LLB6_9MICO
MSNAITTPAVTPWHATIRTAVLASVAVLIVLLAFLWPSYTSKVKDLPIVVAGPTAATAQLTQALSATGAFEITAGTDRAAAVTAIEKREAYGAIVTGRTGIEVLTASAASPVAAQALTGVSQKLAAQAAEQAKASGQAAPAVTTTDIVPFGEKDPRGSNLAVAGLPLAMGGMLGGVLVSLLVTGHKRRLGAVAAYAVVGGLALAAVLGPWLHVLTGSYLGAAAIIGSALFATAALIVGLHGLIGQPGIAIGAVITLFLGNPLSGMSLPKEFLPWHWGEIGQFFVPGASGTLLRLESYFPNASMTHGWLVLAAWSLVGVAMLWFGPRRDDEGMRHEHPSAAQVTA